MDNNIQCIECEHIFDTEEALIGKHPFNEGETIYGCPKCKCVELFKIPDNYEYEEIIKQEYGGNNCKFSGGFVQGHEIDTVYLKWEKDNEKPSIVLLRPDEMQAIAWICNGVLWSNAYEKLDKDD